MSKELQPPIKIKQPGWPSFWSAEALQDQLALIRARAFERGFRQKPQSDEDLIFPSFQEGLCFDFDINWREISDPDHLRFDKTSSYYVDPEWPRYLGCDIAGKKRRGTVLFTIAVSPNGIRHVLDIRLGAWTGPETVRQIQSVDDNGLLKPRKIFVENNAYQESLIDWIKESNASCWTKVRPFRTGSNKMDLEIGLPSIDVQYSLGRWKIGVPHRRHKPSIPDKKDPTICLCGFCTLIRDTSTFTRDDLDETPDTIAAQFIAKEASRQGEGYSSTSSNIVKFSQKDVKAALVAPRQPMRLPVTMDGKSFYSQKPRMQDYGRSEINQKASPHPDPKIIHPAGLCVACDLTRISA